MTQVETADSLLVIDVGNTRIGMTVSDADGVHDTRHVALREPGTWRQALEDTWSATDRSRGRRAVVIASVVPQQTVKIQDIAGEICGVLPVRVRDDIPLPMPMDIENPHEVGVDRICAAAAAYDRIQTACAVASFGSAITIDCVSEQGRFMGGAILPGLDMSLAALHEHAASLPHVALAAPMDPFGKNTHDAIVNGVVYGAVGALREVVERFATDLGRWPQLVVTGGNAPMIARLAEFIDTVVPDLCLMGIALAYRRAAGQA